jgi:hypothetical protein
VLSYNCELGMAPSIGFYQSGYDWRIKNRGMTITWAMTMNWPFDEESGYDEELGIDREFGDDEFAVQRRIGG